MSYGHLPHFHVAFDSPSINWSASYPERIYEHLKVRGFQGERNPPPDLDPSAYTYWYLVNNDGAADTFGQKAFDKIGPLNASAPYAFIASNRGRTYAIFDNPAHGPELKRLGLRAESLARCAFHFLFTPNIATQRVMQPYLAALADPQALRIGIQIRVGDQVWGTDGSGATVSLYKHFFDCAEQIERSRRQQWHLRVVWYLATDSLFLRREAKRLYGSKLVTDTGYLPYHSDCALHNPSACRKDVVESVFRASVAELYLLTKAQYHVVTYTGGFGQLGGWLSGEIEHPHIYALPSLRQGGTGKKVTCGPHDAVSSHFMSRIWSGK